MDEIFKVKIKTVNELSLAFITDFVPRLNNIEQWVKDINATNFQTHKQKVLQNIQELKTILKQVKKYYKITSKQIKVGENV